MPPFSLNECSENFWPIWGNQLDQYSPPAVTTPLPPSCWDGLLRFSCPGATAEEPVRSFRWFHPCRLPNRNLVHLCDHLLVHLHCHYHFSVCVLLEGGSLQSQHWNLLNELLKDEHLFYLLIVLSGNGERRIEKNLQHLTLGIQNCLLITFPNATIFSFKQKNKLNSKNFSGWI